MLGIVVAIVAVLLSVLAWSKRGNRPPGPIAWPVIGNSLEILWREEPFLYFHELGKKYGGIFTFHFGWKRTVVITDPDLGVKAVLDRGREFAGRPAGQTLGSTTDGGKDLAFAPCDDHFITAKKLASTALRRFTSTDRVERTSLACWDQLSEEWDSETGAFNPRDGVSRMALTFGLRVLAGKCYNIDDEKVGELHDSMNRVETMVMQGLSAELLPVLGYFMKDNDAFTELDRRLLHEFQSVLNDIHDHPSGEVESVAAALLEVTDTEALSEERCAHILSDFMAGSNSSVTAALLWLIFYSASYPHAQHKLRDEINNIIGSETPVQLSDRQYMPYTQAFINESLRLRPIMPLGLKHATTTDTRLGGYQIHKDTDVMFSIYSFHRDARYWSDPDDFSPKRWLKDDQLISRPRHYMPFGAGLRICPGETLARNFIFMVFVSLVQRYDFNFPLGVCYEDKCLSNTFISTAMVRDFKISVERRRK